MHLCVLQDTTFEMEKQRNRPVKYDRELTQKTIKAMEKVTEVSNLILVLLHDLHMHGLHRWTWEVLCWEPCVETYAQREVTRPEL